jgi:hypothetical protein
MLRVDLPDTDGGNVISIEVLRISRFERRLRKTCSHHAITVDTALTQIQCNACGVQLNPVEWIAMMTEEWHRVKRVYEQLKEQHQQTEARIQELEAKSKVKCQHCGRFTLRRYN